MASQSNQTPWWTRNKEAGLQSRIRAIQRLNDPTTNADELLKGSKWLIVILLCFTGLLGGISYYKNFSASFPIEAAIAMALALTIAIEWGKNYCSTWAIRTPFFKGWGHIIQSPANSFMWLGLICIALATFSMSIINSTRGGHQLSLMLSQERDTTLFIADTRGIDAQILAAQDNIRDAAKNKWRGTTTTQSQRAITAQSKSIESLNRQREMLIAQQRGDWEKRAAQKDENNHYAANLVLASGGWVELLQILLILVRVACEKALESRLPYSQQEEKQGIGFQRPQNFTVFGEGPNPPQSVDDQPRRPIGFHRYDTVQDSPTPPTVPAKNTVEQCSTPFSAVPEQIQAPTIASILADVKDWQKRANQCRTRAKTQQRPEFQRDNEERAACYLTMLEAVGVTFQVDTKKDVLVFRDPDGGAYNLGDKTIRIVITQKQRLASVSARQQERRGGA